PPESQGVLDLFARNGKVLGRCPPADPCAARGRMVPPGKDLTSLARYPAWCRGPGSFSPAPARHWTALRPSGRAPCAALPIPDPGRRKGSMPATPSAYFEARRQSKNDLAQLQGVWISIAGQRPAELLIAGNLFTVRFLDGTLYMGTFEVEDGDGV